MTEKLRCSQWRKRRVQSGTPIASRHHRSSCKFPSSFFFSTQRRSVHSTFVLSSAFSVSQSHVVVGASMIAGRWCFLWLQYASLSGLRSLHSVSQLVISSVWSFIRRRSLENRVSVGTQVYRPTLSSSLQYRLIGHSLLASEGEDWREE